MSMIRWKWAPLVLCVLLFTSFVILGQDAPPEVKEAAPPPAVAVDVPAATPEASPDNTTILPGWLQGIITLAEGIIAMALTFFLGWLVKKTKEGSDERAAMEALRDGVLDTYRNLYKQLKIKAQDGKLSEDEKQQLRDAAIAKSKELATGPGLKLLKAWGKPRLEALIERLVSKMKGKD